MTALLGTGATDYVVERPIGAGGMAVVHLGTMSGPAGCRRVAIKRIAKDKVSASATARLIAEARLVFLLTHANICQVLDLGMSDEDTFVVMEFVDGLDLSALLHRRQEVAATLDLASALYIGREIARGLDYAHRRVANDGSPLGLVHGDVTPRNILVSREGEVKLSDFGIARALGTLAPGNELLQSGTKYFVEPNHAGAAIDQHADIYSLGVSLFVALGGRPTDSGIDVRGLAQTRPDISMAVLSIIERATAPRSRRFGTASDVEMALAAELARRFPTFTPLALGRIVAEHATPSLEAKNRSPLTIHSMIQPDEITTRIDVPDPFVESAAGPENYPDSTATAIPRKANAARKIAVAAGLAMAGALGASLAGKYALAPDQRVARSASQADDSLRSEGASQQVSQPIATRAPLAAPAAPAAPVAPVAPVAASAPSRITRKPAPRRETGWISVSANPWGMVFIDGLRVASQTPAYRLPVTTGRHRVEIVSADGARRSPPKTIVVRRGKTEVIGVRW